jgi:hypothetical protein
VNKKKQKNFFNLGLGLWQFRCQSLGTSIRKILFQAGFGVWPAVEPSTLSSKSFLVLFCKKELLFLEGF